MKRSLILVPVILSSVIRSNACDVCGGGADNFNPSLIPHLSKNFLSLGYYHNAYRTHFFENGIEIKNREYFNTVSLTGQYKPAKNLQLLAVLPFQFNRQTGPKGEKTLTKPGDAVMLANFKLLEHNSGKDSRTISQTIRVGTGIKFPTGHHHFHQINPSEVSNYNFQAGTGSTDIIFTTAYSVRFSKIAIGTGMTYKINGTNSSKYRFGNRFLNVTQIKYMRSIGTLSLAPYVGLMYEQLKQDKLNGVLVIDNRTGGHNLRGMAGVDFSGSKWALGISFLTSLKQNLGAGQIHSLPGLNMHLSYSL